jgi:phage baseplate assembly protein V
MITIDQLRRILSPLSRRISLMLNRGVVQSSTEDKALERVQVTVCADEVLDLVERLQNFGFASRPMDGAEALVASLGGDRNHTVVIVVDDRRYRPKDLEKGEACLFNAFGQKVTLKKNGDMDGLVKRLRLANTNHEFVACISDFMGLVAGATVMVDGAPQALVNAAALSAKKTDFDTFKVT